MATGIEIAAEGGTSAISVREVARRVGVSAPATYRHFADREQLVAAIARAAREFLGQAMLEVANAETHPVLHFRALGAEYIRFARREPGLLETAFTRVNRTDLELDDPNPFLLLVDSLDRISDAGLIDPARRDGAEIVAWSAVHGLATLINADPVEVLNVEDDIERVLLGVEHALGLVNPNG